MALIRFTKLADVLRYPPNCRAQLATLHSTIIGYVSENYVNRSAFRRLVIQTMNTVSYRVVSGDSIPAEWSPSNPLTNLMLENDSTMSYHLKKVGLYIDENTIDWDVVPAETSVQKDNKPADIVSPKQIVPSIVETPKEDLYIQPPVVPRFLYDRPFASGRSGNDQLVIYTSLPEIPTKQNEISVSTDVTKMSDSDLLNLFPNRFIRTRSQSMYERQAGLEFDDVLGVIPKVSGFTSQDVRLNIIKYPHIFQLRRNGPEGTVSFYSYLEVDGELVKLTDVWQDLPDTKNVPLNSDYMKEYSVRRYLLERDSGMDHNYTMVGSMDPYLTLFTTPKQYSELGVKLSPVELAKACVASRVSYKMSRNPIIRRLSDE